MARPCTGVSKHYIIPDFKTFMDLMPTRPDILDGILKNNRRIIRDWVRIDACQKDAIKYFKIQEQRLIDLLKKTDSHFIKIEQHYKNKTVNQTKPNFDQYDKLDLNALQKAKQNLIEEQTAAEKTIKTTENTKWWYDKVTWFDIGQAGDDTQKGNYGSATFNVVTTFFKPAKAGKLGKAAKVAKATGKTAMFLAKMGRILKKIKAEKGYVVCLIGVYERHA